MKYVQCGNTFSFDEKNGGKKRENGGIDVEIRNSTVRYDWYSNEVYYFFPLSVRVVSLKKKRNSKGPEYCTFWEFFLFHSFLSKKNKNRMHKQTARIDNTK